MPNNLSLGDNAEFSQINILDHNEDGKQITVA